MSLGTLTNRVRSGSSLRREESLGTISHLSGGIRVASSRRGVCHPRSGCQILLD